MSSLCTVSVCPSHQLAAPHCVCQNNDAWLVVHLARSSENSVIIFQSRSLALQPHRYLLNWAVQQTKGLGLTWKFLIRTVSYTSHKPMYSHWKWTTMGSISCSKGSRVNLPSFLFLPRHKRVQPIRSLLPYPALETSRASECLLMGLEHSRSPRSKHPLRMKPRAWIFPTDRAACKHVFRPN